MNETNPTDREYYGKWLQVIDARLAEQNKQLNSIRTSLILIGLVVLAVVVLSVLSSLLTL
jgi:CHASE3 domain sensor protein